MIRPRPQAEGARLLTRFCELPEGIDALDHWATLKPDKSAPFDSFYAFVLGHSRVDPAGTLSAVREMRQRSAQRLSRVDQARLRRLQAHCLRSAGRAREAEREYARAWNVFEQAGARDEMARTAIGWIDALALCGQPEAALEVAREARQLLAADEILTRAKLEANLANALLLSGRLEAAAARYSDARRLMKQAGAGAEAAVSSFNLGNVQLRRGQVDAARKLYAEAAAAFDQAGQRALELKCRYSLAAVEVLQGNWTTGTSALDSVQQQLEEIGDQRTVAAIQRDLARMYASIGATRLAEPAAARALDGYRHLGLFTEAAEAAVVHGRLLSNLGRHHDAHLRFDQAREHWQRLGHRGAIHHLQLEAARAHLQRGDARQCLHLLRTASPYLTRRHPKGAGARCRALAAEAHLAQGRTGLAARLARRAHEDARDHPARHERPAMASCLSRALAQRGEKREAVRWARRSARQMRELQQQLGSERLQTASAQTANDLYRQCVDTVIEHGGARADELALDLIMEIRSVQLIEDLLQGRGDPLHDELRGAISRLRDEMLDDTGHGGDVRGHALRGEVQELEQELAQHFQRAPSFVRTVRDSCRRKDWLPYLKDRSLVLYDQGRHGWRAFVVSAHGHVRRVDLPDAEKQIQQSWVPLRLTLELLSRSQPATRERLMERTLARSQRAMTLLRDALWRPLAMKTKRCVVVPSGRLQGIPVEALALGDEGEDAAVVSRVPHPAALPLLTDSRVRRALLLHGEAPGMGAETSSVQRHLEEAGFRVRRGETRIQLERSSDRLGVLHVASHGTLQRASWLRSGIRLRDGWIGFEHLRPEQLQGALLYLSSCESGTTTDLPGLETSGWLAAGLGAGVGAMVLSLWKVEDLSSSDFARWFYADWAEHGCAARAAAAARAAVRRSRPHPFAWAPFVAMS